MQNLKFKVFYEASGKIYDVLAMDFVKRHVTIEYKKGKTQVVNMDFCKFMQYTGLKDKNGKEIYESDIVEFDPSVPPLTGINPQEGDLGVIEFELGCFIVRPLNGDTHKIYLDELADWIVIGNIYKNKELLG